MSPEIQTKKLELIQWVAGIQDESLIDELQKFMQGENRDWWDDLSDDQKASIEAGQEDIEAGRVMPHEEVKKVYEKWLTK
jgi:predicted transcriptional regulator